MKGWEGKRRRGERRERGETLGLCREISSSINWRQSCEAFDRVGS
mgnify:CR=1 FL=1